MVCGTETKVPIKCVGLPDDESIVFARALARFEGWKSEAAQ
jgi:hypothetical protein